MNKKEDLTKYKNIGFEDLKKLATDKNNSMYEKIGIPDSYRQGKEAFIFEDILQKLGITGDEQNRTWLDIGPGCTEIPLMTLAHCRKQNFELLWADSKEMHALLPQDEIVNRFYGYFPNEMPELISNYQNKVDYIVCYSVLHCGPFYNTCIYKFIDSAVALLKPGGKMLIGDIPNISKRKRLFSSDTGIAFHKEFMKTDEAPVVEHMKLEQGELDDGILMGILMRYRGFGFETYIYPQNPRLPFHNRREDIVICKI